MAYSTTLTQVMESNLIYVVKHVFNVPLHPVEQGGDYGVWRAA